MTSIERVVRESERLEELGDLDGSVALLTAALEETPEEPWLWARRGRVRRIRKDWRNAVLDFDRALALRPNGPTTLFLRGTCLAELGEFDGAIRDLEKCTELQPNSADAYWHLGVIHSYRGDLTKATCAYEKAFDIAPDRFPGLGDELVTLRARLAGPVGRA